MPLQNPLIFAPDYWTLHICHDFLSFCSDFSWGNNKMKKNSSIMNNMDKQEFVGQV